MKCRLCISTHYLSDDVGNIFIQLVLPELVLLDTEMFDEGQAQPGNVGDHEQPDDHDGNERYCCPVKAR